jgi:hypothetical protein
MINLYEAGDEHVCNVGVCPKTFVEASLAPVCFTPQIGRRQRNFSKL